ncbi:MAG TPA: SDR family NAD(P)-dependent oxidoreductase [Solirubrobacteraceae bacterium]|nr:SDR family NAD(P)-dependent oxidoreductase [Solirubrobacteraceae bacterium]
MAVAASRAGSLGVVDLQFATERESAIARLAPLATHARGRWGAVLDDENLLSAVSDANLPGLDTVIVAAADSGRLGELVGRARHAGVRAVAVATCLEHGEAAEAAGADAVIAKGHEAGGWVGEEGAFVLLQRLVAALRTPVWVHGGIGAHTVAAAHVGGAAGAVLDAQLLLTRESRLAPDVRAAIASMDGSETLTLGSELGAPLRVYSRPGLAPVAELADEAARLGPGGDRDAWRAAVTARAGDGSPATGLLLVGQDAAFAADLSRRFATVAGVIDGLRRGIDDALTALRRGNPLSQGSPLAAAHGTRFPIVQGPMTRVSDRAEFAAAVAQAGALPFLALALMRAGEADSLLERTRQLIGEQPWGVGILGFVPPELRAEQLAVVRAHRPPFALIAGGRPDQARTLEDEGITTYLHVPSPGLLKLYMNDGARRFVFEGRECGGHVGPRTSFVLWETMLRVLMEERRPGGPDYEVLFAGGIHDARSAAMVAAAAATATERGVQAGVLLGTAYLFTREATEHGAITTTFQDAAIASGETVLLESGPGHATRCLPSPFVEQFEAEKRRLRGERFSSEEVRARLEELNVGRLRIAAKGVDRNPLYGSVDGAPKLAAVETTTQWDRGMYMIGQVASLHERVTTLDELHRDISDGSDELIEAIPGRQAAEPETPDPADIAIIGLACILPSAPDVGTFWSNILDKVDAIREVPAQRWDWSRMYDPDPAAADKVNSRWGGFIEPVAFDPIALGMPPKSLSSIEPFQLLALLTAQAALRDAGYAHRPFDRERTSVILGAGGGGADLSVGYTVRSALPGLLGDALPDVTGQLYERLPEWTEDSFAGLLMNVAAGRIANRLDFGGTNYTVDAACASSLAAIGLATRELQFGTSAMVLAGGVDAIQNPFAYLCFAKTHALSSRGRCRPFDASADGIAISEGFATVVLKRLADAERDGDRIYAVIRGVGAASDGRDRSLTAPRPEGQMRALRRAYAQARISPATIGLVEAHGTGTVAGDSAEIKALSTVFAEHGTDAQWCAVGSVKSMIGHTKATAGVAGLIKAALALYHRVLPPTIGVTEPNPKANFPESPFYVNSEARPWLSGGAEHPRRAGVSAFGFGGTDFHIVLEEYLGDYLGREPTVVRWPGELLVWRGSRAEIAGAIDALAAALAGGAGPRLMDLALTLALDAPAPQVGDGALAIVAESIEDLRAKLEVARETLAGASTRMHSPHGVHWAEQPLAAAGGRVAFLFPGQGSQVLDMARELTIAFPHAREPFERADRLLAGSFEQPLSRYIFPPPAFSDEVAQSRQQDLTDTRIAQPALGVVELAYLRVLAAFGVTPELAAGHSYGELVALAAAGVLDEHQLLRLSEARGRLMAEAAAGAAGAMAAVDAAPQALEELLAGGEVVAANLNGPLQTVISGPRDEIEAAVSWCGERGIRARTLPVACAFHSPHVAGAQEQLAEEFEREEMATPRIPVYSNTTGRAHEPGQIAEVLAEHLAKPVQFVSEIEAMYEDGARVFVEVGPRAVLTGLTGQILGDREHVAVAVDRPGRPGLVQLLHCLAGLAAEGVPVAHTQMLRDRGAERCDLRTAAADAGMAAPAGRWLVDGGRARPADEPAPAPPNPITPPKEQPAVTSTSTHGAETPMAHATPEHAASIADVAQNVHAPPPVAAGHAGPAPGGDQVAAVMARYQQVMQQFLETERDVMLGYLGAARPGAGHRPTTSRVSAPQLPAPPPAATPPPTVVAAPPSATVAAPAPSAVAEPAITLTPELIEQRLLFVVCERTGYPADMIGLDADMEGDLGIDSIKRVEIAGTFTQELPVAQRGSIDIEQLTASRTLREVIAVLESSLLGASPQPVTLTAGEPVLTAGEPRPFEQQPAETERIGRYVVQPVSAPAIAATAGLAARGAVMILGDDSPFAQELAEALAGQGDVELLTSASAPSDELEAAELASWIRGEHGAVKALVHLASAVDEYGGLRPLFLMVQALQDDLIAAADAGGAAVLSATRLGGAFGFDGEVTDGAAGHGAIAGFLKTLAIEWPSVRVKAVDLAAAPGSDAVGQLVAELGAADGLVEVGYHGGERLCLQLVPAALSERDETGVITEESVVLVTGGARGITAEVGLALARRHRSTLVLVGRTALDEEPAELAALREPAELRRALIDARRHAGAELTPALVEADLGRILRAREVRSTLERMREAGARVEYHECDVQDQDAFADLIGGVYERLGRIDGVIHGAGLIEDRLVADKRLESLGRVLATKAASARTLADSLRPEQLRFLVLFSSVSGRFGNRGQADYAAASEVLSRLALELDRRWPARVVSIDWGPWSGAGMAAALEHEFTRRGVALIPPEVGCAALVDELARGHKGESEVVIGAATGLSDPEPGAGDPGSGAAARMPLLGGGRVTAARDGTIAFVRELTVAHDRYLDHHRVDGKPVFPFAAAMELMSECATVAAPERRYAGLREIRLLKGIVVPDAGAFAVKATATARGQDEIEVVIGTPDSSRPHYRSVALMGDAPASAAAGPPELAGLAPFPMSVEAAYRDLLFHGPLFQGISAVTGMDERGSSAVLSASTPERCLADAAGLHWLLDPVLIDSALQVQVVWARLHWDVTLLPAQIGGYTRVSEPRAAERIRHELRIRPESSRPMCHADHWFFGADGRLLATLGDVVGVGTQALNRLAAAST